MSNEPDRIPVFPTLPAQAFRFAPLHPLSLALTAFARRLTSAHPGLVPRLGEFAHARFVIDPTDLPVVLILEPQGGRPKVSLQRGAGSGDARIAGPLAALLGLVHGVFDGDALFFSRDLVIEGDTAAALALRNAIDDAELDLAEEVSSFAGPFSQAMQRAIAIGERKTGVALSRHEEDYAW